MNIYEWCLESYLTHRRQVFCRVRDLMRVCVGTSTASQKSFDYLVGTPSHQILVEVKGRSFPTAGGGKWENWITGDDLDSLTAWGEHLGPDYVPVLAFIYHLRTLTAVPDRPWTPVEIEGERFGLVACPVADYRLNCRRRSAKWNTFTVPRAQFAKLVQPLEDLLPAGQYEDLTTSTDALIEAFAGRLKHPVTRVGLCAPSAADDVRPTSTTQ